MYVGTDDTAAIQAAINKAALKGGTVYLPQASGCPTGWTGQCSYLVLGQLTLPSTAASQNPNSTHFNMAMHRSVYFTGDGPSFNFPNSSSTPPEDPFGGTILDMRYSGAANTGKIDDRLSGALDIGNLTFTDNGYDSTPYIFTLGNNTLNVHDNYFDDNPALDGWFSGTTVKDAIQMGNGSAAVGASWGSNLTVERNKFERIRRGVYGYGWFGSNVIRNNYWYVHNGAPSTMGAIELDAGASLAVSSSYGNKITDNNIGTLGYTFGIKLTKSENNTLVNNVFSDTGSSPQLVAVVKMATLSTGNTVITAGVGASSSINYIQSANVGNGVIANGSTGLALYNPYPGQPIALTQNMLANQGIGLRIFNGDGLKAYTDNGVTEYFRVSPTLVAVGSSTELDINGALKFGGTAITSIAQAPTANINTGAGPVTVTTGGNYFQNYAGGVTYNLPIISTAMLSNGQGQFCFANYYDKAQVLTLKNPSATYIDRRGVVGTAAGTLVSGGALGDTVCLVPVAVGLYQVISDYGTWTNN
jgi:hypothetical protein